MCGLRLPSVQWRRWVLLRSSLVDSSRCTIYSSTKNVAVKIKIYVALLCSNSFRPKWIFKRVICQVCVGLAFTKTSPPPAALSPLLLGHLFVFMHFLSSAWCLPCICRSQFSLFHFSLQPALPCCTERTVRTQRFLLSRPLWFHGPDNRCCFRVPVQLGEWEALNTKSNKNLVSVHCEGKKQTTQCLQR